MTELDRFAGETAIVTGGASGIGLAIAQQLASRGAHVVVADVDGDALAAAADRLGAPTCPAGRTITFQQVDVRDRQSVRILVEKVIARHGHLDLLFNNAGVVFGGPTHELTGEHWDRIVGVNVRGVINGILAAYPGMVERRRGHIVNTASGAGLVAPPFLTAYAATKHAVVGLSTGLRPEAARHGVRITVLCPGAVDTPILDRGPPADLPTMTSAPVTGRQYLHVVGQAPMTAAEFARRALQAIERNKAIVVIPRRAATLWYVNRLLETLARHVTAAVTARVERRLIRSAK